MREAYPAPHVVGLSVAGVAHYLAGLVHVVHGGAGNVANAAVAAVGKLQAEANGVGMELDGQEIEGVAVGLGDVSWNK